MSSCSHCGLEHAMDGAACPITEEPLREAGPCGTTIDRYEVEKWLGGGGFGAVYRARHVVMDRPVALKLLHGRLGAAPRALERFFLEAKAAAAIGHPSIVQIFDAGMTPEGAAFLAMELVDGCSLQDVCEVGPLAAERAVGIAMQVLDALEAAHARGIVHRDVKPGNIMLVGTDPDGTRAADRVKLVDFGISKVRKLAGDPTLTRSNMAMGSPGYAAPEQYVSARDVDARADVYGVGVVLYRLLAGELPFDADSYEQMVVRVCTSDPMPLASRLPNVSPRLAAAVDRAIARDRDARPASAKELSAALAGALARPDAPVTDAHAPTIALPSTIPQPPARRRSWGVLIAAGLTVAVAAVAAALLLGPSGEAAPEVVETAPAPSASTPEPRERPRPPPADPEPAAAPAPDPQTTDVATPAAPRHARRARRHHRPDPAPVPAPETEPAPADPTASMRHEFGTEDLEPF